jgi:predicted ester cyclase
MFTFFEYLWSMIVYTFIDNSVDDNVSHESNQLKLWLFRNLLLKVSDFRELNDHDFECMEQLSKTQLIELIKKQSAQTCIFNYICDE